MDFGKGNRSPEFRRAGRYASPDRRDAQKCVTTGELRSGARPAAPHSAAELGP